MTRLLRAGLCTVLLAFGACSRVTIPAVGIDKQVIIGGQAEIDQGKVVAVEGLPGIWIAAHRSSAGGPFAALLGIDVGDDVYTFGHHYRVAYTMVVPQSWPVVYLGPVVLQTSWPGGGAFLAICVLVE